MTAIDCLRYLAHEGRRCREHDVAEAICLLLPAMCRVLAIKPMDDFQSLEFHVSFREELARVNSIPLVEAACAGCGHAEALREDLFSPGPARGFCDICQREQTFQRSTTPQVAGSHGV